MTPKSIAIFLLSALAVSSLSGCAKVVVVPVPKGKKIPAEGVFYALPKTVVRMQVQVDRKEPKPAPFMKFAAIFAPGNPPVCQDEKCSQEMKSLYSLKDNVAFSTFGEPDPDEIYMVKFVGGGALDQALSMTWNEMGLPVTAANSVTNRSSEIALSGLRLVSGIIQRAAYGAATTEEVQGAIEDRCATKSTNDKWVIPILRKQTEGQIREILIGNYCDIELKLREIFKEASDSPRLEQAARVYQLRVVPLEMARLTLLAGTYSPLDPASMLDKIEGLIKAQLKELYIGDVDKKTWQGTLDAREFEVGKAVAALGIDAAKGICTPDAKTVPGQHWATIAPESKPVPSKFNILTGPDCQNSQWVSMEIDFHPAADKQVFNAVKSGTRPPQGDELSFRYRIPAQVKAEIKDSKKRYGAAVLSVAQLGHRIALPAKRHSKTLSYDLAFIEATGGLKSFKLGLTGGLDSGAIDSLAEVSNSLLDARNAEAKRKREAADELSQLTRRKDILEAQDKICTVLIKYGLPCEVEPPQ